MKYIYIYYILFSIPTVIFLLLNYIKRLKVAHSTLHTVRLSLQIFKYYLNNMIVILLFCVLTFYTIGQRITTFLCTDSKIDVVDLCRVDISQRSRFFFPLLHSILHYNRTVVIYIITNPIR